ncbi:MAG: putative toxin-antitoxin system toxin component, PIN family [Bauldia sp.]|nr:putative toxin-antitoxin system toxin component, PIN family [Bauldia sp.]
MADPPRVSGVVRDPNDDMVLACAVGGSAQHIVTRDKDLLSLGNYADIAIVAPETFIHVLRSEATG